MLRILIAFIGAIGLLVGGGFLWVQSRYEAYPPTDAMRAATPADAPLDETLRLRVERSRVRPRVP